MYTASLFWITFTNTKDHHYYDVTGTFFECLKEINSNNKNHLSIFRLISSHHICVHCTYMQSNPSERVKRMPCLMKARVILFGTHVILRVNYEYDPIILTYNTYTVTHIIKYMNCLSVTHRYVYIILCTIFQFCRKRQC